MKFIKLGLISLLLIAILLFFISALLPSEVRISRAINIEAPTDSISSYLGNLERWKDWNIFVSDTILHNAEFYHDSIVSSNLRVVQIKQTDSLLHTIWYRGRHVIPNGFTLQQSGGFTVVQWYFDFELRWYPWEKFASIIFDKQFGPPMERSLELMKKKLESTP